MIVVADAGPLIFLAKIRQLGLLHTLFGRDIRVPSAVSDEILVPDTNRFELASLQRFLASCRVEPVPQPRAFAESMSAADNAALTLAIRVEADFLLCDERLTRLMAEAEGVRPIGTLGVLLRAMHAGTLSTVETRRLVDSLVGTHSFRIGVELYQAVLRFEIERSP